MKKNLVLTSLSKKKSTSACGSSLLLPIPPFGVVAYTFTLNVRIKLKNRSPETAVVIMHQKFTNFSQLCFQVYLSKIHSLLDRVSGIESAHPCETESYVMAKYGRNWLVPIRKWNRKKKAHQIKSARE